MTVLVDFTNFFFFWYVKFLALTDLVEKSSRFFDGKYKIDPGPEEDLVI